MEGLVLEVEEDHSVVGVKPSTSEKDLAALHNRSSLIMIIKEGETLQEMEEVEVEVEELLIIAINAISWGIGHLSVKIVKNPDTQEQM